jgi:hypothetical protein
MPRFILHKTAQIKNVSVVRAVRRAKRHGGQPIEHPIPAGERFSHPAPTIASTTMRRAFNCSC